MGCRADPFPESFCASGAPGGWEADFRRTRRGNPAPDVQPLRKVMLNVVGLCIALFCCLCSPAYGKPSGNPDYPDRGVQIAARWGEPLERVVGSRGIRSFVDADSESLLLGVPVHVLLADEVVLGRPCRVLYSFLNNGLVEYAVHFDRNEDSGRLHAEIKRELGLRYRGYRGELFPNCEDVFVDETGDTLLLLLRHEGVVLYFADMKACARFRAAEREREGRR